MTLKKQGIREVILTANGNSSNYWRDLWEYRELLRVLAWRDIAVRYKQTMLGAAWAVIRPVLTVLIFTLVFGRLAKFTPPPGVPYGVMVLTGMLPWQFFASALADASNSLIANANLVTKVYFPRAIVPMATIGVALVDLAVGGSLLILVMLYYGIVPGWRVLCLPLFVMLSILASLGPSLIVTSFNVKYRDFRYIIPFLVQFGLYISPVGFPSGAIPEHWRAAYQLNPMVGIIDGFRWCLLGDAVAFNGAALAVSIVMTIALLLIGVKRFRGIERRLADII